MTVPPTTLSLALTVIVSALLTAYVYRPGDSRSVADRPLGALPEQWRGLSAVDRSNFTERYRAWVRRPDAEESFRRARRFAALPAKEQAALRSVYVALNRAIGSMPATRRLMLIALDERSRAESVHRHLQAELPDTLRALGAELRGGS